MNTKNVIITTSLLFFLSFNCELFGQYQYDADQLKPQLPKAFVISDYESALESHSLEYHHLLEVCNNDINQAFNKWLTLLANIEQKSKEESINLDGVKLWLQVFFDKEGKIENIAYHLKPNSKNIDKELLTNFFSKFATSYELPLSSESKFSHYTAVSFPVFGGK